jgi:GNAT superfamily N-acetyltransferase
VDISFAPAGAGDADELARLRVEAMRECLERIGRFDPARARARLLDGFSPAHTRWIVADGVRAGFLVLKAQDDALLLEHLYVRPGAQSLGVGAAALRAVFAEADASRKEVRVGALRGSDSNRFYARHGFRLVRQEEFDNQYVRQPADAA